MLIRMVVYIQTRECREEEFEALRRRIERRRHSDATLRMLEDVLGADSRQPEPLTQYITK